MLRYILPATSYRVRLHTKEKINSKINISTNENINYYKNSREDILSLRIEELDHEWDIERVLETNAAIATLITISLGLWTKEKKWFVILDLFLFFYCSTPYRVGAHHYLYLEEWVSALQQRLMKKNFF